jgi:phosphate transport system permease protein
VTPGAEEGVVAPADRRRLRRSGWERFLDRLFTAGTMVAAGSIAVLLIGIAGFLTRGSLPTLHAFGFAFLYSTRWDPSGHIFGVGAPIFGTLLTSGIALLIGVPVSLGVSTFLSEDAPPFLRTPLAAIVELLAAIPSVVYGLWGIVVLAPLMRTQVEPTLRDTIGRLPGFSVLFGGTPIGTDVLTAGVILSIMIIPTVSAVSREAMSAVPRSQREAALALGATRWETTRTAVLPYASTGIFGAAMLGLGRAFGETMAVTMTIGNTPAIPSSLFGAGQTLASGIAGQFGEAGGDPYFVSALLEAGLVLLGITLAVNIIARLLVRGVFRGGEVAP